MKIESRLSKLEIESAINKPIFDSVEYREGKPIQYDGKLFENESMLIDYCAKKNILILPICLVSGRNS